VELYLRSRNTSSWRGAQLKHRDKFTFTFYCLRKQSTHKIQQLKQGISASLISMK